MRTTWARFGIKIPYILPIYVCTPNFSKGKMTYALLVIIAALTIKQNSLLRPLKSDGIQ